MNELSQSAKELLALKILEEFGSLKKAKSLIKKDNLESEQESISYLVRRFYTVLEMIDEVEL